MSDWILHADLHKEHHAAIRGGANQKIRHFSSYCRMVNGMVEKVTVKLPVGFDSTRHLKALAKVIAEKYGEGFEIDSIDPTAGTAYAIRQAAVTEIGTASSEKSTSKEVRLMRGTKPSDGDKVAAKLADQHPGFVMVRFEPFLGRAILSKMDPATQRAREAVAVALGTKPWDVTISTRPDGGYDLELPKNYVPSKHDGKLDEVATAVIGQPGWQVAIDPQTLKASIVPGEPPTFPVTVPYPLKTVDPTKDNQWAYIPLGVTLGKTGDSLGPELTTDFVLNPHMSIQGLTGSGKGQTLMALMTGALARGWELAICDAIKGGVDFTEWKPYVRDGGWGDDLVSTCCVISLVYNEGLRRKSLILERGVVKWTQLPKADKVRPLMLVVDELTSLIAPENVPKGVPKDSPLALEVAERNLIKATILNTIGKIARELRFAGVSMVAATQVASTVTGVPTELRANLGAKLLLGGKPTNNNRAVSLNDPDAVPRVPLNIVNDPQGASQGVGVYEFEGREPGVVKGYFAISEDYTKWLQTLKIPTTNSPRPTPTQIAQYTPSIESEPAAKSNTRRVTKVLDPVTGEELHGFDRANEQRRQLDNPKKLVSEDFD
ncbi:MAG: FtsK/SpoIIIE domain-containing protein [Acidimicrobiales bacterium]